MKHIYIYTHRDNFQAERIQGFFIRKSGLEKNNLTKDTLSASSKYYGSFINHSNEYYCQPQSLRRDSRENRQKFLILLDSDFSIQCNHYAENM